MAIPEGSEYKPNYGVVTLTSDTTLTNAGYAGLTILLDNAAGVVLTLPEATGSGATFEVLIKTTVTSNAYDIRCPTSSEFVGHAMLHQDSAATIASFDASDNDDEISMNGSTTGGLRGGRVKLVDAYTGHWFAYVESAATGTEATPFTTIA